MVTSLLREPGKAGGWKSRLRMDQLVFEKCVPGEEAPPIEKWYKEGRRTRLGDSDTL